MVLIEQQLGHLEWDLQELIPYKKKIEEIITKIYNDETDEYDAVWKHNCHFYRLEMAVI